jgi:type VI secretion system protein ImpA
MTLLQPIPGREPVGEWLRYEGTYDAVQEARQEEDESLPKGIWTSKVKRADWAKVDALCQKALRERSKDLQLAVWLAEAWLQLYGLPGFAGGLQLCAALLNRFWESLYPVIDEGEVAYRLAPLEFLDRKVALRVKLLPLVQAPGDGQPQLNFTDWERALYNDKTSQSGGGGELSPAQFLAAAAATPSQQFVVLHAELLAVEQAAAAVEAAIAEHTGEPNSVLRSLRALVSDILVLIAQYTPEAAPPAGLTAGAGGPGLGAAAGGGGGSTAAATERAPGSSAESLTAGHALATNDAWGPIKSRNEAFRRLTEAADYLLRTEPHSPVPYLVKRAVSWGNMSLAQLLVELVGSEADRGAIYTMLGIPAPK